VSSCGGVARQARPRREGERAPDIVAFPGAMIVPAAILAAEAGGEVRLTGGHDQVQGVRVKGHPVLVQQTGHHCKQLRVAEPGSLSPYSPPVSPPTCSSPLPIPNKSLCMRTGS
jgi:hypothetical protein